MLEDPRKQRVAEMTTEEREMLVEASRGLSVSEAKNAFAKAVVEKGKLDPAAIKIVTNEKKQIIRKSGILEFYPANEDMGDIGGLDELKKYVADRSRWWTDEAKAFGMGYLKGIVILGIPGTGKSLTAKVIPNHWGLPLIRLDMGRIFDKFVGGSELNIRTAMNTAEAVAPCVLWIDEVEKAMAVGSGDNGTSRRVFGQFLTWMQEKKSPVFVVCTANDISQLPPEFLRKGRFENQILGCRRSENG